jgi:isoprenylcysteine carboxyl methyltransferase (ICMT) family protein YpbQ
MGKLMVKDKNLRVFIHKMLYNKFTHPNYLYVNMLCELESLDIDLEVIEYDQNI